MSFKNDSGLFETFRAGSPRGLTAKQAMAKCNAASPASKHIDIATVYRFLKRHGGEFEKVKGRRFVLLNVAKSNVIPFKPKAKKMKDSNYISKVQQFVLDGYRKHAQTTGLTTEDLDRLLRQEDPENPLLGKLEKRRVAHATTRLKQLGLIEQCGTQGSGPNPMGLCKIAPPKPAPEPAAPAAPAEVIPVTRAADAAQKKGVVLRKGEWSMELPPDMSSEEVAKLMNELAVRTG